MPAPRGLCGSCGHAQDVPTAKGAVFVLCRLSASDPRFPKYPRLPVIACAGYTPAPVTGRG
jgi:hypothetical protein